MLTICIILKMLSVLLVLFVEVLWERLGKGKMSLKEAESKTSYCCTAVEELIS